MDGDKLGRTAATVRIKVWTGIEYIGTWFTSYKQLKMLGLQSITKFTISLGSAHISVTPMIMPEDRINEEELLLSKDVISQLHIPFIEGLGLIVRRNHLVLGPLIGLFVSPKEVERLATGYQHNFNYRIYSHICRELNALSLVFCIEDIVWEQGLIKGWTIENEEEGERWVSRILPIPTVIYDRCFGPNQQKESLMLRSGLSDIPETVVFNSVPKLRKWESYQVLIQNPQLTAHLPETKVYSTPEDLTEALEGFGQVYVKPDNLSKGKGVFRVARNGKGLVVESREKKQNKVYSLKSQEQLNMLIKPYQEKGEGYLIQQPIELAKYRGYPFDMRVLCQKDIQGQWIIAGIAVRIAALGSVITSPRSGGTVAKWSDVLSSVFNQKEDTSDGINDKLSKISVEVCCTIEEEYGYCGELGLDLAVDVDGKLWIIEVNGKPLKVSLKRLLDVELNKRIFANPIKYAWYLGCNSVKEDAVEGL